jgi:hypothetical protein
MEMAVVLRTSPLDMLRLHDRDPRLISTLLVLLEETQ